MIKSKKFSTWINTLLGQGKSYIYSNLILKKKKKKKNDRSNQIKPKSFKEILDDLRTYKDDYYYRTLSI